MGGEERAGREGKEDNREEQKELEAAATGSGVK